jgi:hypothetical protein
MKRIVPWLLLPVILIVAYVTKPDDKTCIIAAVDAVWGYRVPNKYDKPDFYEQFMNITSKQVYVDDWIFLKRIRYRFPKREYNIGIGAFHHVFVND